MDEPMFTGMTGGCQCGAIRFRTATAPMRTTLCHCRMCQKAVGQPFAAYATVTMDDFAWTRGTPGVYQSSSVAERHFCAACGTSLTFRSLHEREIGIAAASFDHPEQLMPSAHYGVESRLPWMATSVLDGLRQQTTDAPGVAAEILGLTNYQHPDHDTPEGWSAPRPV